MHTTDKQVRTLMSEMNKHGHVGLAAAGANMDRKTARKYLAIRQMPSALTRPRDWKTRECPFSDEDWAWVEAQLEASPTFEAKTLFESLRARNPGAYDDGQLRTMQRLVKTWRALKGPEKMAFLAQQHRPGEAAQTDFTWANELNVTILGVAFAHMFCHFVLPFSNWQWVTVCSSESMAAITRGVQSSLFQLGRIPIWHQTDNSTAATHLGSSGERCFNDNYLSVMAHFGMKPRTTGVGEKEQNGDVESANGVLKRRLEQMLLVRGSRDFESVPAYEKWAQSVCNDANKGRSKRFAEELAAMPVLRVKRLAEHQELDFKVSPWGTIRVNHNAYSVPSRLIGETLRIHLSMSHLEVFYAGKMLFTIERISGRNGHAINYRHVVWSLVNKPGGFARYRYRDSLFPSLVFRRAYDAICEMKGVSTASDLAYSRVLHLAAATLESEVQAGLELLLEQGITPCVEALQGLINKDEIHVPLIGELDVELSTYDSLLASSGAS